MKKTNKKELEKLTVAELREIAKKNMISLAGKGKKEDIVEAIVKGSEPVAAKPKTTKTEAKKTPVKKVVSKKTTAAKIETPKKAAAPKKKTTAVKQAVAPKKAVTSKKTVAVVKEATPAIEKGRLSTRGRKESKFENLDQSIIEQGAKFYIAKEEPVYRNDVPSSIPESFMCSHIKLIVRDPGTLFTYWHVSEDVINDAKGKLTSIDGLSMILRIVQVNNGSFYEIDVPAGVSNRYIESPDNDCPVKALLGFSNSLGEFVLIVESNVVCIPAEHEAESEGITEEENALYAMSLGVSEEEVEEMKKQGYERFRVGSEEFLRQKLQEQISSHLVSSVSSAGLVEAGDRKFRLWVDAELIVYGETEPDATVTIGGKKIELTSDGGFSFHMAFPDGEIPFPIKAESSDGVEEREIDLFFNRNTERFLPRFKK